MGTFMNYAAVHVADGCRQSLRPSPDGSGAGLPWSKQSQVNVGCKADKLAGG